MTNSEIGTIIEGEHGEGLMKDSKSRAVYKLEERPSAPQHLRMRIKPNILYPIAQSKDFLKISNPLIESQFDPEFPFFEYPENQHFSGC